MSNKLTALIPVYNDGYAVNFCLKSIIDFFDEIIVLDDCSCDDTCDVISGYGNKYKNVKVIWNKQNQLGWAEARKKLYELTDSNWLFFIDSDDVLAEYNAHYLEEIAEGSNPYVLLQLTELWGDFDHGTGRIKHYDPCHIFINRTIVGYCGWGAKGFGDEPLIERQQPTKSQGPLFFHVKGVKPDRRLVERKYLRKWIDRNKKGRFSDSKLIRYLTKEEEHKKAIDRLLNDPIDQIAKYKGPIKPKVLLEAPNRFEMIYDSGLIIDRSDTES